LDYDRIQQSKLPRHLHHNEKRVVPVGNSHTYSYANAHTDSDRDSYSYAGAHTSTDTNCNTDSNSYGGANRDTDANSNSIWEYMPPANDGESYSCSKHAVQFHGSGQRERCHAEDSFKRRSRS
jgi:hypothetical protein